jgi:hypothetical protein
LYRSNNVTQGTTLGWHKSKIRGDSLQLIVKKSALKDCYGYFVSIILLWKIPFSYGNRLGVNCGKWYGHKIISIVLNNPIIFIICSCFGHFPKDVKTMFYLFYESYCNVFQERYCDVYYLTLLKLLFVNVK